MKAVMKQELLDKIRDALADRNMAAVSRRAKVPYLTVRDIWVGNYGRIGDDDAQTLAAYFGFAPSQEEEEVGHG
jgi:hypothetical protein